MTKITVPAQLLHAERAIDISDGGHPAKIGKAVRGALTRNKLIAADA